MKECEGENKVREWASWFGGVLVNFSKRSRVKVEGREVGAKSFWGADQQEERKTKEKARSSPKRTVSPG